MSGLDEVYVSWESTVYPDGGMYEGLMKDGQCHGKGVFQYADGDRYEGEYVEGQMNGLGVYRWSNGSIFKGYWKENNMHGCGKKWYPGGALEEGEWIEDNFVGDFGACDAAAALGAVQAAERVAADARDFMNKPDGDVNYKQGLDLHQDPHIYTIGTEYLMPGPAGNLYKVPNDPAVRSVLVNQARRAIAIFNNLNFPEPPAALVALLEKKKKLERSAAAAATPAPSTPTAARGKASIVDDDDDDDDDEEETTTAQTKPPRRPTAVASLSLGLSRHSTAPLAQAFTRFGRNLGRALRKPRLARVGGSQR